MEKDNCPAVCMSIGGTTSRLNLRIYLSRGECHDKLSTPLLFYKDRAKGGDSF